MCVEVQVDCYEEKDFRYCSFGYGTFIDSTSMGIIRR